MENRESRRKFCSLKAELRKSQYKKKRKIVIKFLLIVSVARHVLVLINLYSVRRKKKCLRVFE